MPIIRSLRLYVFYYRLWRAMPWLLVVGGQVQAAGYAFEMRDVAPQSVYCAVGAKCWDGECLLRGRSKVLGWRVFTKW